MENIKQSSIVEFMKAHIIQLLILVSIIFFSYPQMNFLIVYKLTLNNYLKFFFFIFSLFFFSFIFFMVGRGFGGVNQ